MTKTISIAPVKKTLTVNVSQARAFDVFTSGMDRWWPRTHHTGETPMTRMVLEPRTGGRWYSVHEDGRENTVGEVKVWNPPNRIVHSWNISAMWKPDANIGSEVEVRFIAEGPNRTRVELEHRDFESYGEQAQQMRDAVSGDGGWNSILDLYRKEAENNQPRP
jgi:hypothetical protein